MRRKLLFLLALMTVAANCMTVQAKTIEVPQKVVDISEELGGQYSICPELIQAICWRESRFTEDAANGNCVGIMQVNTKWHKERMKHLGVTDLMDARQNMTVAVDYLAEIAADGRDIAETLMIYHGESNMLEKLEKGEISDYAAEILTVSEDLERKNGK